MRGGAKLSFSWITWLNQREPLQIALCHLTTIFGIELMNMYYSNFNDFIHRQPLNSSADRATKVQVSGEGRQSLYPNVLTYLMNEKRFAVLTL